MVPDNSTYCEREDEAHLLKVCSNFVQVNLSVYFVFFFWYIQRIAHSTRMGDQQEYNSNGTWRHCMILMLTSPTQP